MRPASILALSILAALLATGDPASVMASARSVETPRSPADSRPDIQVASASLSSPSSGARETRLVASSSGLGPATASAPFAPVELLLARVEHPALAGYLREVLERNPRVATARARAEAARRRPIQEGALPDPQLSMTLFALPPETRAGPQQVSFGWSQRIPGFGKLGLKEQAAVHEAAAAAARVEAERLSVLTEARRWWSELAFHAWHERILRDELELLDHFEELARSRYASGAGLQAEPLQLQAEITRQEVALLRVEQARESALAAVNALRARPARTPVDAARLDDGAIPSVPDVDVLVELALAARPELLATGAEVEAAERRVELARRMKKPSFGVGAAYTLVGRRDDPAARANPPADDGDDVLALTGSIVLPVRRRALAAGVEEAVFRHQAALEERRSLAVAIERDLADLVSRLRVTRRQLRLFDDVLEVQAEEALRSVEGAYAAGSVGSLDLLDAARVLYDVQLSSARTRADHAITAARLEGSLGAPLRRAVEDEAASGGATSDSAPSSPPSDSGSDFLAPPDAGATP